MTEESRYEAVCSRDARFDGEFYVAVLTTGIYCRPSCPAVTPKRRNVRFYRTAAAAQRSGFRACRRCRPDAVPGSAEWDSRADLAGRAVRLIQDGVVDREGVAGLAARLGYSVRQVNRQLTAELGAGPVALARAQRAHTARVLLQTTALPASEVAFAAGFASVRQFNDTVREVYALTPGELRRTGPGRSVLGPAPARAPAPRAAAAPQGGLPAPCGGVSLRLAHRGPYAATEVFDYLQRRALAGIEEVSGQRGRRTYRRTLRLPHGTAVVEVDEGPDGRGWLPCRLRLAELRDLGCATQRMRCLFDLDADPFAVAERLGADPLLGPAVTRRPGLRVPGTADPYELAVRAVLGQQVSVAAGRTLGGGLVAAYGERLAAPDGGLTHLFPRPADLAEASLTEVGIPAARRATLRALSAALAGGTVRLDPGVDRTEATHQLLALRGIGPWTAGYVRMRALGDPDVFLAGDAAVRAALRRVGAGPADAEAWRPWRSYAMHHLWQAVAPDPATAAGDGSAPRHDPQDAKDPKDPNGKE